MPTPAIFGHQPERLDRAGFNELARDAQPTLPAGRRRLGGSERRGAGPCRAARVKRPPDHRQHDRYHAKDHEHFAAIHEVYRRVIQVGIGQKPVEGKCQHRRIIDAVDAFHRQKFMRLRKYDAATITSVP
jgi:hypothetical protein